MSKSFPMLLAGLCLVLGSSAEAQTILLQDGRRVTAKSLRRQGDNIMATDPVEEGKTAPKGEVGYPLSQIETLEFPEPAQLGMATALIGKGRGSEAIAQLDQALRYYEGFRDAPGSYWADLALLKANTLLSLDRDAEAETLASLIASIGSDPETLMGGRAVLAACMARRGEHEKALPILAEVLKKARRPDTVATASVYQGECQLAAKEFEPAILSFLTVPVFYPEQANLQGRWMLGAGRAFFGAGELVKAKETLGELINNHATAPEVPAAKAELEAIERREKALEGPA